MRSVIAATVVLVIAIAACATPVTIPVTRSFSASAPALSNSSYVLVGGQNGTWFKVGQDPRLEKIDLASLSVTQLTPSQTQGTVWGGGWNGSQWLISGWGEDLPTPPGSNPYIFLYNGIGQIFGGSMDQYQAESTWHGGDIFAASSNGKEWLLSGLGSGLLPSYGNDNHMALAVFNGNNFTDLSESVPNQADYILYTNAWNGKYWLIGGGYMEGGVLFSYDGNKIVDLSGKLTEAVPTLESVQTLGWNGNYWLIGGIDFLATYDGQSFTDLTPKLKSALGWGSGCCSSVNAIAWDGAEWVIGGGTPVAQTGAGNGWLVKYAGGNFTDLTSKIYPAIRGVLTESSVLSIAATEGLWVIGGYSKGQGSLYEYTGGSFKDISYLVSSYTYVDWVGGRFVQEHLAKPYDVGPREPHFLILLSERQTRETAVEPADLS